MIEFGDHVKQVRYNYFGLYLFKTVVISKWPHSKEVAYYFIKDEKQTVIDLHNRRTDDLIERKQT